MSQIDLPPPPPPPNGQSWRYLYVFLLLLSYLYGYNNAFFIGTISIAVLSYTGRLDCQKSTTCVDVYNINLFQFQQDIIPTRVGDFGCLASIQSFQSVFYHIFLKYWFANQPNHFFYLFQSFLPAVWLPNRFIYIPIQ